MYVTSNSPNRAERDWTWNLVGSGTTVGSPRENSARSAGPCQVRTVMPPCGSGRNGEMAGDDRRRAGPSAGRMPWRTAVPAPWTRRRTVGLLGWVTVIAVIPPWSWWLLHGVAPRRLTDLVPRQPEWSDHAGCEYASRRVRV